jgi:hypothetical protein
MGLVQQRPPGGGRGEHGEEACTFLQIYKLAKYLEFVQGGMPTVASAEGARR